MSCLNPTNSGHDALLRLASIHPAQRNPNKPLTPFSITDILNAAPQRSHIKRPWDENSCSPSRCYSSEPDDDDDDDDDDGDDDDDNDEEEIYVDDDKPQLSKSVCPLDALLKMASKTFDATGQKASRNDDDTSRRDSSNSYSKCATSKKRRKSRTAFTNKQIYELEKRFLYQKYLTPVDRDEIAQSLGLTNAQVITWFQNRRAKLKRDVEELKADMNAAKALGTEPSTTLLDNLEELLKGTKNGLKKKETRKANLSPKTSQPLGTNDAAAESPDYSPLSSLSSTSAGSAAHVSDNEPNKPDLNQQDIVPNLKNLE